MAGELSASTPSSCAQLLRACGCPLLALAVADDPSWQAMWIDWTLRDRVSSHSDSCCDTFRAPRGAPACFPGLVTAPSFRSSPVFQIIPGPLPLQQAMKRPSQTTHDAVRLWLLQQAWIAQNLPAALLRLLALHSDGPGKIARAADNSGH